MPPQIGGGGKPAMSPVTPPPRATIKSGPGKREPAARGTVHLPDGVQALAGLPPAGKRDTGTPRPAASNEAAAGPRNSGPTWVSDTIRPGYRRSPPGTLRLGQQPGLDIDRAGRRLPQCVSPIIRLGGAAAAVHPLFDFRPSQHARRRRSRRHRPAFRRCPMRVSISLQRLSRLRRNSSLHSPSSTGATRETSR